MARLGSHRMWTEHRYPAREHSLNLASTESGGPPIVLLHGVTRCWQDWLGLIPALRVFGQVHALDHRGHGKSDRAARYQVMDYARDAIDLVRSLDRPAIVVGHSLGAMAAACVAAESPDRVRALVLEDPTFEMTGARIDETSFPDVFRAYTPHAGSDAPTARIAQALSQVPIRVPWLPDPVPFGSLRDAAAVRFTASCLKRLDPRVLPVILEKRWLEGCDVAETLHRIACPTLFLQADFAIGGALPDDYARDLAALIPDCVHLKLNGVGHGIHSTQPVAMLNAVVPFLSSLDTSP